MERISCVMELKKHDFHYNVYDELIDMYNERTNFIEYFDFYSEYLEYVKDDNDENFKKYNKDLCSWAKWADKYPIPIENSVECKLCMLKKDFLEIEKDTCVFITKRHNAILMFYLKEDSKNIELAKEVWKNELNCGNFAGDWGIDYDNEDNHKYGNFWKWNSFDIKNKEKYIPKSFTYSSYTQIVTQTKFVMNEVKL